MKIARIPRGIIPVKIPITPIPEEEFEDDYEEEEEETLDEDEKEDLHSMRILRIPVGNSLPESFLLRKSRKKRKTEEEQLEICKHYMICRDTNTVAQVYGIGPQTVLRYVRMHKDTVLKLPELAAVDIPKRFRQRRESHGWITIPNTENGEVDCNEIRAYLRVHKRICIKFGG